jgi:hypothetical protein
VAVGEIVAVAEGLGVAVARTGLGEFVTEGMAVAVVPSVAVGTEVGAIVGAALHETTNNNRIAEISFFNFHLSLKIHDTANQIGCQ